MNNDLSLIISGTSHLVSGSHVLLSAYSPLQFDSNAAFPYVGKADYIVRVVHEDAYISYVYVLNPEIVHPSGSFSSGSFHLGITIPRGKRLRSKSPFDLIQHVWNTFKDLYMEQLSDGSYQYNVADAYNVNPFLDILDEYELEDTERYIRMTGERDAVVEVGDESGMRAFLADTQYSDFSNYSGVLVAEHIDGPDTLHLCIPRPIKYEVKVDGECIGLIDDIQRLYEFEVEQTGFKVCKLRFSLSTIRQDAKRCSFSYEIDEINETVSLYPYFTPDVTRVTVNIESSDEHLGCDLSQCHFSTNSGEHIPIHNDSKGYYIDLIWGYRDSLSLTLEYDKERLICSNPSHSIDRTIPSISLNLSSVCMPGGIVVNGIPKDDSAVVCVVVGGMTYQLDKTTEDGVYVHEAVRSISDIKSCKVHSTESKYTYQLVGSSVKKSYDKSTSTAAEYYFYDFVALPKEYNVSLMQGNSRSPRPILALLLMFCIGLLVGLLIPGRSVEREVQQSQVPAADTTSHVQPETILLSQEEAVSYTDDHATDTVERRTKKNPSPKDIELSNRYYTMMTTLEDPDGSDFSFEEVDEILSWVGNYNTELYMVTEHYDFIKSHIRDYKTAVDCVRRLVLSMKDGTIFEKEYIQESDHATLSSINSKLKNGKYSEDTEKFRTFIQQFLVIANDKEFYRLRRELLHYDRINSFEIIEQL